MGSVKFKVRAFKCKGRLSPIAHAWCMTCCWGSKGVAGQASHVTLAARRHTEEEGHETRIETRTQCGYAQAPDEANQTRIANKE